MSTALAQLTPEYMPEDAPTRLRTIIGGEAPQKDPTPITAHKISHPRLVLDGALPKPKPIGRHWTITQGSWDYSSKQLQTETVSMQDALPDANSWSRALALAVIETLTGKRYPSQLERFVNADLYDAIERRVALAKRLDGPAGRSPRVEVLSSRTCVVNEGVVETTHVINQGGTIKAIAIRLEARRRQWIATAVDIL